MNSTLTLIRYHFGFVLCLLPIPLLWADIYLTYPFVSFSLFFIAMPLFRSIFLFDLPADMDDELPNWLSVGLSLLPHVFAVIWLATICVLPFVIRLDGLSMTQTLGVYLACWIVFSLSLTVAHDLCHRRSKFSAAIARLVAAGCGQFYFVEEHRMHHAKSGAGNDPDAANVDESIYAYMLRTIPIGFNSALEWEIASQMRKGLKRVNNKLLWASLFPSTLCLIYFITNGVGGSLFYLLVCAGTFVSFRTITYIQHWGLQDAPKRYAGKGYSWDSTCILQSWITLNIAFHEDHHLTPSKPYHLLIGASSGLCMPFSYPIMFLIALFPQRFKRMMMPRLTAWFDEENKFFNPNDTNQSESCATNIRLHF